MREAWLSLPDALADRFPTPTQLRKAALIEGGFFDETLIDAGTNAAALRVAAHLRHKDEFAHVVVRGAFVVERIAKSQKKREMGGETFEASKRAVLEIVGAMIGVPADTLARQTEAA